MIKRAGVFIPVVIALALAYGIMARYPIAAQEKEKPAASAKEDLPAKGQRPEAAAVRQANRLYAEAFARADAKAIAALWTEDGEYNGVEAEPIRGRAALEASYARFFKENPKATLVGRVDTVRMLGPHAAIEEGTLQSRAPGEKEHGETSFSAFLVLEDGSWRFASVREWLPEPQENVSLDDLAWLAGEWVGKGKQGEARLTYTLDENKAFLRSRYSVIREGKVTRSGTQIIGKDPNGGLRSWQFESDGGFGEWSWSRDGKRWVIEGAGTLPDGDYETASHLLIPIDKDTFTWQLLEGSTAGVAREGQPPVKVTRVRTGK